MNDIYVTHKGSTRAAIHIDYIKSSTEIVIDGWFDTMCALPARRMTLKQFFAELGIDEAEIRKALK